MFKFYEVGGKIRDEILGIKSSDVDYVAVPEQQLLVDIDNPMEMFKILTDYLSGENFEIFLNSPACYTVRARFPDGHQYSGVADFVMARKEVGYIPSTRTPIVVPGTLYDDLERRDFTVNALARGDEGEIIDFFGGVDDLRIGMLKTPLDCLVTFNDDPLRILRALRFSITRGLKMSTDIVQAIHTYDYNDKMVVVSQERIWTELHKCLKHNTLLTLQTLEEFNRLRDYIFTRTDIWLKPTLEE